MAGPGGLTPPRELAERVGAHLPDGPLVVALSGGPDSATLALVAAASGHRVRAVTVDHGLHAPLVEAARRIAAVLDLAHEVVVADDVGSSEGALREARAAALEAAAAADESILTGHTRDDQAETVLSNLLRGAGTTGLSGIPPHRGHYVRPMLDVSRDEARAAAEAAGLPFVDDPANADRAVRRNRLRHETLPDLASTYNPELTAALARTAAAAAADDRLLERRAGLVPLRHSGEAVLVPAGALRTLPPAVAVRVARRALRAAVGPHAGTAADAEAVCAAARTTGSASLSRALLATNEGAYVAVHPVESTPAPDPVTFEAAETVSFGPWTLRPVSTPTVRTGWASVLPAGPLRVRAVEPGDVISMGSGSKSVVEALREAGVPPRLRPRWPVVEADARIAWLVGIRSAPWDGVSADVRTMASREGM